MLDRIAHFYQKTISQTLELPEDKTKPSPSENAQGLYTQYQAYKKIEQPSESRLDQVKEWIQEHGEEVKKHAEKSLEAIDTAQLFEGVQDTLGGAVLGYGGILVGAASCTTGVAGGLALALPSGGTSSVGGSVLCSGGLTVAAGALGIGTLMMHQGVGKIFESANRITSNESKVTAEGSTKLSKSESPVWKNLKQWRDKTKTNGLSGKNCEYYEWDHTHGEIEVYDSRGKHKGVMDALTGESIKNAKARKIDL